MNQRALLGTVVCSEYYHTYQTHKPCFSHFDFPYAGFTLGFGKVPVGERLLSRAALELKIHLYLNRLIFILILHNVNTYRILVLIYIYGFMDNNDIVI